MNHLKVSSSAALNALRINLAIVILAAVCLGTVLNLTNIDMWIASLFADGVNGFPYSKHWLTDTVLHAQAARLSGIMGVTLISFNIWQWIAPSFSPKIVVACRYLMVSWLSTLIIISVLKRVTTLPCPWNLTQFGGTVDYVPIYNLFSSALTVGECFPSAHASGGYGFIGLGFIALMFGQPMRKGFLIPILIGLLYGGAQIVRGAHFVSHDLFTIAISLSFAWFWAETYLFGSAAFSVSNGQHTNKYDNVATFS